MLPTIFLTIPQIQRERHAGSKLLHLTRLLEYLLKFYNPNVTAVEEDKYPTVGERVLACEHLFDNVAKVLWALKVRNSFAHVIETADFTKRDYRNAVDYLIEAIGDVCEQQAIPRQLVQEIYHDQHADLRSGQEEEERRRLEQQLQAERERQAQTEQAQKHLSDESGFEELRQHLVRREMEIREKRAEELRRSIRSRLLWLIVIALLAVGGYFLWPKLVTLYKRGKGRAEAPAARDPDEKTLALSSLSTTIPTRPLPRSISPTPAPSSRQ